MAKRGLALQRGVAVLLPALLLLAAMLPAALLTGCAGGGVDADADMSAPASVPSDALFDDASSGSGDVAASFVPASVPSPGDAEPEETSALPPLHVEGTGLADPAGNAVLLRGVSTHGLAWFPGYVNAEFFRELHEEWNANVVRLAMYTAESGGYCTGGDKEQLKQLLRDGVRYAEEQGLYVIVDWHILSDGDPNRYAEEAKAFFAEMSAEFAPYDHVLYEICNEPNGAGWSAVKAYAEQVIPLIRANDPDAVILVGTPTWSQDVDQAAADPITGYDDIMYTLHFYAATHRESLRSRLTAALDAGLPVFVSEYGICDASGNGAIDFTEADAWMELLNARGVGCVAWNLSNKAETSAMFTTSCTKTSGFVWDDLSASGQWVYEMLTGQGASGMLGTAAPQGNTSQGNAGQSAPAAGRPSGTVGKNGAAGNQAPAPAEAPGAPAGGAQTDQLGSIPGNGAQTDNPAAAPAGETVVSSGAGLSVSAVVVNQWEADGKPVYQYSLTVTNTAQRNCDRWKIDLSFAQAFTLLDGWNGEYTVQGNTLMISGKDYNGALAPGGSAADIGCIVAGGGGIVTG